MMDIIFLHGDLHLDNIVANGTEWLAIDPKGVLREFEFECAAFDFIAEDEMAHTTKNLLLERISHLSEKTGLSFERI